MDDGRKKHMEEKMRRDWFKEDKEDGKCMHCGKPAPNKSYICDDCYSQYTHGMLSDLDN